MRAGKWRQDEPAKILRMRGLQAAIGGGAASGDVAGPDLALAHHLVSRLETVSTGTHCPPGDPGRTVPAAA
ncbi:MAG: hypothetical protein Kow001_05690 [Acidobacteriota bacterium]